MTSTLEAEPALAGRQYQNWFTVWSSIVHGGIMGIQAVANPHHIGHLLGDVAALIAVAAVLAVLTPRQTSATKSQSAA